jgi:hypothetical protein
MALQNRLQGHGNAPNVIDQRALKLWHRSTELRWKRRQQQRGNFRAFVPQGNKRATVLDGHDAVMFAFY